MDRDLFSLCLFFVVCLGNTTRETRFLVCDWGPFGINQNILHMEKINLMLPCVRINMLQGYFLKYSNKVLWLLV